MAFGYKGARNTPSTVIPGREGNLKIWNKDFSASCPERKISCHFFSRNDKSEGGEITITGEICRCLIIKILF